MFHRGAGRQCAFSPLTHSCSLACLGLTVWFFPRFLTLPVHTSLSSATASRTECGRRSESTSCLLYTSPGMSRPIQIVSQGSICLPSAFIPFKRFVAVHSRVQLDSALQYGKVSVSFHRSDLLYYTNRSVGLSLRLKPISLCRCSSAIPWPSVLSSAAANFSFHGSFVAGQSFWGDLVPGAHPSSLLPRSTLAPRGLFCASLFPCPAIILAQSRCSGAHSSSVQLRSPFRFG
jgi:hypothetical protein